MSTSDHIFDLMQAFFGGALVALSVLALFEKLERLLRAGSWTIARKTEFDFERRFVVIPCPSCEKPNRLPQGAAGVRCASCKAPLTTMSVN